MSTDPLSQLYKGKCHSNDLSSERAPLNDRTVTFPPKKKYISGQKSQNRARHQDVLTD
jgi:hypothetical protein